MRCVLLLFILGSFLSVGVFSAVYEVYAQNRYERVSQVHPIPTSPAIIRPTESQRNILVILVDHQAEQNPILEGIWLVVYLLDKPRLTFLPVFPVFSDEQVTQQSSLASVFHLESSGKPASDFLEMVKAKDIRWDEILVFDKVSLAVLIDMSGGLASTIGPASGTLAVSQLPAAAQEPKAALENQAILAGEICQKMSRLMDNPDTPRLLELLAGRVYSETEFSDHFPGWSYFRDLGGNVSCEFPTFSRSSSITPDE